MRIAWATDIHLNFVDELALRDFIIQLRDTAADAFVISGDIGEAHTVTCFLAQLDNALGRPLYFVLGNHDYYFGSIHGVREQTVQLCTNRPRLHYLTHSGWHSLTPRTAVVGHDGWADGREGDYARSYVSMNDYRLIAELTGHNKLERLAILQQLGDEAARHVETQLRHALRDHEHVLLVTHVPPLREACWYDGRISDDEWSPHFTCQAIGCKLLAVMDEHPEKKLTVVCGHTHGYGEAHPRPNIVIYTGGAEYGHPVVARVLEVE